MLLIDFYGIPLAFDFFRFVSRQQIHATRIKYARRVYFHAPREKTRDALVLPFSHIGRPLGLPFLNDNIPVFQAFEQSVGLIVADPAELCHLRPFD